MFCSNCGAQIPNGAKFCPVCGANSPSGTTKFNPAPTPCASRKKPWILVVCCCVAALLLAGGAFLGLRSLADSFRPSDRGNTTAGEKEDLVIDKKYVSRKIEAAYLEAPVAETAGENAIALDALLLERVSYEVTAVEDGECTVDVTAPDMVQLMERLMQEIGEPSDTAAGQALLEQRMLDVLEAEDYELRTVTVTATVDADGNFVPSYALTDAMYGGMFTMLEQLLVESGLEG